MFGRLWLSIAAAAVLASAATAHATPEVVELRYTAPDGCPTRDAIEAAILARTTNVRFATPGSRVFALTLEATADGFRGTLTIDEAADKELGAQRCDDLANAFALVTALAIDPTASVLPPPPLAPSPPPPVPAPLLAAPRLEADLDAMVDAGVGPVAMFAAVIEARMRWRDAYWLELAAIVGRDGKTADGAEAHFTWLAARPAACRRWPWDAWKAWASITVDACGHIELGAVHAAGDQIINERDLTRLWLAAGAHGMLAVPLHENIFAQLQLGASMPLVRDRYLFAPNVAIHETPAVTGWLVLGIGLQFR
jgi:hypothetical protein